MGHGSNHLPANYLKNGLQKAQDVREPSGNGANASHINSKFVLFYLTFFSSGILQKRSSTISK